MSTILIGWQQIEDFKSPVIGERLCRNTVKALARLGFLRLGRTASRRIRVSDKDLERAWLAREEARDLDADVGGRPPGNQSDLRAAARWAKTRPHSRVATVIKSLAREAQLTLPLVTQTEPENGEAQ